MNRYSKPFLSGCWHFSSECKKLSQWLQQFSLLMNGVMKIKQVHEKNSNWRKQNLRSGKAPLRKCPLGWELHAKKGPILGRSGKMFEAEEELVQRPWGKNEERTVQAAERRPMGGMLQLPGECEHGRRCGVGARVSSWRMLWDLVGIYIGLEAPPEVRVGFQAVGWHDLIYSFKCSP